MRSKQFLSEIRQRENLKRAVLRGLVVEGYTVTFRLVTDRTYTAEDVAYAERVASRYVPAGFQGRAAVMKSIPDAEGVRCAILDILKRRSPAVAAFILPEEVVVETDEGGGRFFIPIDENERALLSADGVLDALHEELGRMFCGTWTGEFRFKKREMGEIEETSLPPAERVLAPRTFKVTEFSRIDGGEARTAIYIADLNKEAQGVAVCGKISYIDERQTKNGKPWFSITLSDGTGNLRASCFPRKASLEKLRGLRPEDSVLLSGDYELYNGSFSFKVKTVDYGRPPKDFVPEARPSRPCPAQYRAVFPAPDVNMVQGGLFEEATLSDAFKRRVFVVFDLETTGLNMNPVGGQVDRIIELGAVKIQDGRICERFSTFVACPTRLPAEIVRLTGITDDMLIGAPRLEDVIADFYRFAYGAELVAHNGFMFDFRFIRYYGEKEGFLFNNRTHDTLNLSQELLPMLSNHKLDTVAEKFGFTFNHHRAYDDAFVTAKIFLEFAKRKEL